MIYFAKTATLSIMIDALEIKPFTGKKALIIGGTGGIGRAIALKLAENGAELAIHGGSSLKRLESTLGEIQSAGGKASGFLFPINKPEAAEKILALSFKPDILICAWGPFKQGALETHDSDFWREMVGNNLIFPGILVSLCLDHMIRQKWGRILLFGGTNTDTIRAFSTSAAYSAAKTALGVIAKSAAKTMGPHGGSCNVLCPGLTDTEYCPDEQKSYNQRKSPDGKPLNPEQIAKAALAILMNGEINGSIIPVDKGLVL